MSNRLRARPIAARSPIAARTNPLRTGLALFRLVLFFIGLCFLLLAVNIHHLAKQQDAAWMRAPLPSPSDPAMAVPFLGVTVELEQYEDEERLIVLNRLATAGFDWARQHFAWAEIEPAPGVYDWKKSDAIINALAAAGLVPIVVLDGSPAWARAPIDQSPTENPFAPPVNPHDFARFAGQFAARYATQIRFYQLWHEPNIAPHWGNRLIEPVEYAQLLKAASGTIRAADPDAVLITAALAPTPDRGHTAIDEVYFLQRLYAAGAGQAIDAVAVEPFGFGLASEDARAHIDLLNFQRVKVVRRAMIASGHGETPLWAARYGWNRSPNSPWGTVTPGNQMEFAQRAIMIVQSDFPWLATMGWAIDQPLAPRGDPMWGYSLTPPLTDAITQGIVPTEVSPQAAHELPEPYSLPWESGWFWWVLVLSATTVGQRSYAAFQLLPYQQWATSYQHSAPTFKFAIWGLVLVAYYLATFPPLILLGLLAIASLTLLQPFVALSLAAVALPFYFQHKEINLLHASIQIAPAYALLLCMLPAIYRQWRRTPLRLDRWNGLALAWLGVHLISSVNIWHWPAYWRGLFDLVLMPLLGYIAVRFFANINNSTENCPPGNTASQRPYPLLLALFIGGVLAGGIGLDHWFSGGGTEADAVRRLVGPHFSPNHTALYLERTLFVGSTLVLLATQSRLLPRISLLLAWGITAIALLLTASRGALLLGLPTGLLVFPAILHRHQQLAPILNTGTRARTLSKRWLAGLMLVLFALLFAAMALLFWERISNSVTILARLQIWQATFALWQDYPLFGVGPGGYFWRYPAFIPIGSSLDPNLRHPHNVWLEHLASGGLLSLLWLITAIVLVGRASWQRPQQPYSRRTVLLIAGLVAGLVAGFAHAQVDAFAALADLAGWNWFALGILDSLWTRRSKSRTS